MSNQIETFVSDCFARDTMLLMADNTMKAVSKIEIGEILMGVNGESLPVINVCCGYDSKICCIQTRNKKQLLVTERHPIATTQGIIRALRIQPGMPLPVMLNKVNRQCIIMAGYGVNVLVITTNDFDPYFLIKRQHYQDKSFGGAIFMRLFS